MLTDTALKNLKPKEKTYKVSDRDGMYAEVKATGRIVFRFDYRLHGRRETLTIGHYGRDGVSLAEARERCIVARKAVKEGQSPAQEKQREKRRLNDAHSFGEFAEAYFRESKMADSTRAMRRHVYDRDIAPAWKRRLLGEITPEDLRGLCGKVKERGAPATAIHVRDIVKQIYGFAILHGEKIDNPADAVGPSSIATFEVRERALSPSEIRIAFRLLERVATLPTIRLGLKLILLTLVRKSELQDATWDEIDFENTVWSIPKELKGLDRRHFFCWKERSAGGQSPRR
jgi:integrase